MNNDSEFYAHVEYDATNIFLHEEFYPGNLYNDIAIIRLNGYVDYARKYEEHHLCFEYPYVFQNFLSTLGLESMRFSEMTNDFPSFAVRTSTRSACPTGSRTSTGGAAS